MKKQEKALQSILEAKKEKDDVRYEKRKKIQNRGQRMSLATIFLLVLFVLVAVVIALKSLMDTSAFRIYLVLRSQAKREKEEREEAEKYRIKTIEEVKNPDRLLDIILKIKKGEEVKIPLAAFTYIYQNLNNFTLIDNTGKLTILDEKSYFHFKKNANELLEKSEPVEINVQEILDQEKGKIPEKPIEITEYPDGTIVKRDHIKRTREIIKPNGDKIFVDMKNNSTVFEKIEDIEEEQLSKKEYAKQQQQKEKEEKEKEQKIKLLEAKNKEQAEKLKALENIANGLENSPKEEQEPKKKEEPKIVKKDEKQNDNVKEKSEKKIDPSKDKIDDFFMSSNAPVKKTETEETEDKPENINVVDDIKQTEVKTTNLKTLEFEDFKSFQSKLTHKTVVKFIDYLLHFDLKSDLPLLVFDEDVNCILINLNYFAYKIYMSIKEENERETFLNEFYSSIEKSIVYNKILGEIIEKINHSSVFRLGFNLLYQEKKDGNIINFKTTRIKDRNGILHQGIYLYLFLNNSFGKEFKESDDFMKIESCAFTVVESKERGEKIFFNDILETKK